MKYTCEYMTVPRLNTVFGRSSVYLMRCLVAHRYIYSPCSCKAEPRRTAGVLLPTDAVSHWNDFGDPVFDGVGLADLKSKANAFTLV